MQYSISEKLMWFALAGRCFRYLEEKETHTDRKRARQIFRQMTARIPDIGTLTENPLRICLSAGMVWLSIYEAADGQMEDACFGEMVQYSMESPLVKATYKGKAKTAFTMEA
ncbi:MAG: hypothetical protein ACI4MP_13485, partial [Candidatus Ventricola sp.]